MGSSRNSPNGSLRHDPDLAVIIAELQKKTQAMKAREIASLLQVTQQHIYKQAAQQLIPSFRVGRAVRFDPKQVAVWLQRKLPHTLTSQPEMRIAV